MRPGLGLFFLTALVVLGVVAGTNLLVDPFGMFGTPRCEGFNQKKVVDFEHDRVARMVALRAHPPDCLLVGSSRVAVGFDTDILAMHDCLAPYNAGLAGATLPEVEATLVLASERTTPRRVLIALDLFMFNATRHSADDSAAMALKPDGLGLTGQARFVLGVDTFKASIETVVHQDEEAPFADDGSLRDSIFGATFRRMRDPRALFLRGIEGYIEHNLPPPNFRFAYRDDERDSLGSLRRMLAQRYRAQGTETIVFFSPAHAWQWQLLRTIGLEEQWIDFKRQTAAILIDEAARVGREPFPLYDFSRFDTAQTSEVPPLGRNDERVPGYWDASHFDKTVGSRVLAGILQGGGKDLRGLGPRLDVHNIEPYLRSLREDARHWQLGHPEDVAQINGVVGCYAAPALARRLGLRPESEERCRAIRLVTR